MRLTAGSLRRKPFHSLRRLPAASREPASASSEKLRILGDSREGHPVLEEEAAFGGQRILCFLTSRFLKDLAEWPVVTYPNGVVSAKRRVDESTGIPGWQDPKSKIG